MKGLAMGNLGRSHSSLVIAFVMTLSLCAWIPASAFADETVAGDGPSSAVGQTDATTTTVGGQATVSDEGSVTVDEAVTSAVTDDSQTTVGDASSSAGGVVSEPSTSPIPVETDGWHSDANGSYYVSDGVRLASSWAVTADSPDGGSDGLQRYWVGADGYLARGRLVTSDEAGYWAYATASGAVVRGRWADPSTGDVYIADNDGRLAGPGWVVGDYGDGLQRYWVDATAHACVPGYSTDGWAHYTLASGYVVRGRWADPSTGYVYIADNDGRLAGPGWVVGDYGDGLQRYWVDATAHACVPGYSADGWAHYTLASGRVVRGRWADPSTGYVYLADNDGRLAGPGWVVGDYGDGLQRYWVDASAHACVPGYSADGWAHYTLASGCVLRGAVRYDSDGVLVADNDGRLAECYSSGGWLVTAAFSGSLERYRIDDCCGGILGAHVGAFEVDGSLYYGNPSTGYVARNTNVLLDGTFYRADNDGRLSVIDIGGNYAMWAKAQGYTSSTNYLILINCSDHLVGVYYGGYMNWTCIQMYACGNGKDSTPTVKGSFTVRGKGYSFGSGFTCYFYTQFYGDYLLHSILYYQNSWTVMDGRLGMGVSHGCVRLATENAEWIYDNIPLGTRVISY